ncbi:MAG: DUF3090 family protein [Chloroflexi bacterium]|nr:DUF3090 family protein [Chloroflexota bacterium]MDA1145829.1 DUF3090 family protein [Chloroflexota bacterium]
MIDFGLVDAVDAEAIGAPGQRTFRLRANKDENYASLWFEKEQLSLLGREFSKLLAERSRQRGRPTESVAPMGPFPANPQIDLQVARLGLDFDEDTEHIVLLADDAPALQRGDSPTFRMEISRAQAIAAMRAIDDAVSGGRPLCPLCNRVLEDDGGCIACPGSNGHSKEVPLPPAADED